MALDKYSDEELAAIANNGDLSQYSDAELEAIAGGGQPAPMSAKDVAVSAVKNIPQSAGNFLGGIYQSVRHPVDTAKGLGKAALGTVQLAIPGEQGNEDVARNVGQFFKERYGGLENFKRTVATDPVGVLADASTLLTGAGGLVGVAGKASKVGALANAGKTISNTGKALEPFALAGKGTSALARFAVPQMVRDSISPQGLYQGAMKFSNNPDVLPVKDRRAAVQTGLEGGYVPNEASYNRLWGKVTDNKAKVNSIINAGDAAGDTIPTKEVMRLLQPLEARSAKIRAKYPEFADAIDEVKQRYAGSDKIPVGEAQILKETLQDLSKYGTDDRSQFLKSANKAVARGIRIQLEQLYPDLAKLNKESSALLNLENQLAKAVGRVGNRDIMNLGLKVALGGAGLDASLAQKSNVLLGIIDVPNVKARLAVALHKAQTGQTLPVSKWKKAAGLVTGNVARQAMFQGGRLAGADSDPLGIRMSPLESSMMTTGQ